MQDVQGEPGAITNRTIHRGPFSVSMTFGITKSCLASAMGLISINQGKEKQLIGTVLLKKTAVIIALLMLVFSYAKGRDVSWSGPKQLTTSALPDEINDSTTIYKTCKIAYFYAILNASTGNKLCMVASAPGRQMAK